MPCLRARAFASLTSRVVRSASISLNASAMASCSALVGGTTTLISVSVVDTVGAGDAFTAGLLAARLADQPWLVAASYAVALAAEVVKRPGGAPSLSPEVLRDIHW